MSKSTPLAIAVCDNLLRHNNTLQNGVKKLIKLGFELRIIEWHCYEIVGTDIVVFGQNDNGTEYFYYER